MERYYARHIKEGLVHYSEKGGDRIYLITNSALMKMNDSFDGKPIYNGHDGTEVLGYVVKSFYNEIDGAWWAEILLNEEGQGLVNKGWAVSNAYTPTEYGAGGEYHDIRYVKEILNGEYEHLALTNAPRYEEAVIMNPDEYKRYNEGKKAELEKLKNSKEKEMISEEEKKELYESLKNSLTDAVKDIVKNALDEKIEEEKKNSAEEDHRKLIDEIAAVCAKPEADFNDGIDEKVRTVIKLAEKLGYSEDEAGKNSCKKNEDESEDKAEEEAEDKTEVENEADEDKSEEKEEKKENSKFFSFLHNAKSESKEKKVVTMGSGLALGRARYGSK